MNNKKLLIGLGIIILVCIGYFFVVQGYSEKAYYKFDFSNISEINEQGEEEFIEYYKFYKCNGYTKTCKLISDNHG